MRADKNSDDYINEIRYTNETVDQARLRIEAKRLKRGKSLGRKKALQVKSKGI